MEHALVAGGAGFIGSHLCATLLARGFAVTCVDNLKTGAESNIAPLKANPRFRFLSHDVIRPLDLDPEGHLGGHQDPEGAPVPRRVDLIFHLASPASVSDYLALPMATLQVNSIGTLNLLDIARRDNARFLFASTSEVYGDPLVHPQPESYWGNVNPIGPRACYDESKRFGEVATLEYYRGYDLDCRIVRIFNTYGPHSRPEDGRIIPNFVTQALRDEPITVYGDGRQTRSFCYVSDMVEGIIAAMLTDGATGEVFNLGNPDEYTVLEVAQLIAHLVGNGAGIVYRQLPVDDPTRRCPDIAKARTMLGWQPAIDLAHGLERTVTWFREALGIPALAG